MPFVSAENSLPLPDDLFYAMKSNAAMALELDKRMLLVNLSDRNHWNMNIGVYTLTSPLHDEKAVNAASADFIADTFIEGIEQ